MPHAKRLLLIALLALCLASCHNQRRVASTPTPDNSSVAPRRPRTLTQMQFTAEVDGLAVSGQVRLAEDSLIWVSVTKLIEVGRALATTDSVFLHAPLLGREEATTYADLQRRLKQTITFADLQRIATADDAEQQASALASKLGFHATVHITSRRTVSSLSFPYPKPAAR